MGCDLLGNNYLCSISGYELRRGLTDDVGKEIHDNLWKAAKT